MATQKLSFYSDGLRLDGLLSTNPAAEADSVRAPVLVVCSGLHGLKEWVPSRWMPYALGAGFHGFAFDYRGFGTSEGERGRVIPAEEVRDTLHALTYVRELDGVDPDRVCLLGWGLGGGIAICAAAQDPAVAALCVANGAGDYGRTVRDAVEYPRWLAWQERLAQDRTRRIRTETSERVDYRNVTNPGFDPGFDLHAQFRRDIQAIGQAPTPEFTLESCEAYSRFRPEEAIAQVAPRPVLIVHGGRNHYMPVSEAHCLHEAAREPKTLRILPDQGHLEMISPDNPASDRIMTDIVAWLRSAVDAG